MSKEDQNKLSVAMVEPVGGHSGMNYYDIGLCKGLVGEGVDVTLYTSDETDVPPGLSFTINRFFKGIYGRSPKVFRAVRFVFCLLKSLRDGRNKKCTIAHFHFFHSTLLEYVSLTLSKLFGYKTVVTIHDVETLAGASSPLLSKVIYNMADFNIVHNDTSKKELLGKFRGGGRLAVIPHGNYLDFIDKIPDKWASRQKLGIEGDGPLLLFFGQIKKVKGLDVLLESLTEIKKVYPKIKLLIAGRVWKDDFYNYEKIIKSRDLEKNVLSHIKYIPDDMVSYYYGSADLVVLPYRKIYQSGVLLMAMSYGRPVLVSDIDGMRDVITDGENGFVFKDGSSSNLSEVIVSALNNRERLEAVASNGFKYVEDVHGWNAVSGLTRKVYEELV